MTPIQFPENRVTSYGQQVNLSNDRGNEQSSYETDNVSGFHDRLPAVHSTRTSEISKSYPLTPAGLIVSVNGLTLDLTYYKTIFRYFE